MQLILYSPGIWVLHANICDISSFIMKNPDNGESPILSASKQHLSIIITFFVLPMIASAERERPFHLLSIQLIHIDDPITL